MSLTNNSLESVPQSGVIGNSIGNPRTYNVSKADLVAGGAFTTVDVVLDNLPAGAVVIAARIKHHIAVAGTSFSASTARLFFNGTALGSGTLDVFAAPSGTAGTGYITDITGNGAGKIDDVNVLLMRVTSAGGNLSATTAGSINAQVDYTVLKMP